MKRSISAVVLGVVCFALGAAVQRFYDSRRPAPSPAIQTIKAPTQTGSVAAIRFDHEPLWAYGFDTRPAPGEKALPQTPPTRNLRPNEDPVEQTRRRHLDGSRAIYSLVDVRDGQNVIDWFPGDHPPMPNVVAHGPAAGLGNTARGCGSCHLPNGKGRPEMPRRRGFPSRTSCGRSRIFETACAIPPIRESRTPTR